MKAKGGEKRRWTKDLLAVVDQSLSQVTNCARPSVHTGFNLNVPTPHFTCTAGLGSAKRQRSQRKGHHGADEVSAKVGRRWVERGGGGRSPLAEVA